MLQLKNVVKDYATDLASVRALNSVSLNLRESEFVAILGPSGCGKTTLLNILGGLDKYTSGDIIINGVSTKNYNDKDWDSYRNHSVGFVFQSYNLIPHQSVLKNVELALTLSGINREERRQRAKEALEKVGLGDQLNKRPNQMSGGQMQRVAIARAIVNNPDIILADEPTGALDTQTSVQIMEILKELSKTKLVVMVTHNPELAQEYATRIINLKDGVITGDTMPFDVPDQPLNQKPKKERKPSMSFLTALSLSLNNLITKKARTILTSFAGSIGIIGIALILSLSAGFNTYIDRVQQETLTSYPLSITQVNIDYTKLLETIMGKVDVDKVKFPNTDEVTTQNSINDMVMSVSQSASLNDLQSFKKHIDKNLDKSLVTDIKYSYNLNYSIYRKQTISTEVHPTPVESYNQVYPVNLPAMEEIVSISAPALEGYYKSFSSLLTQQPAWTEIIGDKKLIDKQYDYLAGHYPEKPNEMLLVVDQYNQISDLTLYQLGLITDEDISYLFNEMILSRTEAETVDAMHQALPTEFKTANADNAQKIKDILKAKGVERTQSAFKFTDLLNNEEYTYSALLSAERLVKKTAEDEGGATKELFGTTTQLYKPAGDAQIQETLGSSAVTKLKFSGIVRLKDGISNGAISGNVGYTSELVKYFIDRNNDLDVVKDYATEEEKANARAQATSAPTTDMCYVNLFTGEPLSKAQYTALGGGSLTTPSLVAIDLENPKAIAIYPTSFENKDAIIDFISDYNNSVEKEKEINYSDIVGMMMSSITVIVNAITYILIAFVSISLVVSSIMIGIITYISVLERTKEIGVLRSIGASKRDIKRVFNAETMIVGFTAGMIGIIITLVLNVPINIIINALSGIANVASLPVWGGVSLVVISIILTTIAGLLPASMASKKDPVVALRSE